MKQQHSYLLADFQLKEWNTKYLRKLESHTNALAVNLPDNSELYID
jgi:hypothetical protein